MVVRCVNCKREIAGTPFNDEPWVGSWCSAACQEEFDRLRNDKEIVNIIDATHLLGDLPPTWMLSIAVPMVAVGVELSSLQCPKPGPQLVVLEREICRDLGVATDDVLGVDESPFYLSLEDALKVGRIFRERTGHVVLVNGPGENDVQLVN